MAFFLSPMFYAFHEIVTQETTKEKNVKLFLVA